MKRRLLSSLAVAVAVFTHASLVSATVLRPMSLTELVAAADEIVVANVVSVESAWDVSHRRIFSTIAIEVQERWKGSGPNRLLIVQSGGTVGDVEMTVHGSASFSAGERALLFLRGHERMGIVGMSLGKRPIRWDAKQAAWLVEPAAAEEVFEIAGRGELRPAAPDTRVTLESLRARVRALALASP